MGRDQRSLRRSRCQRVLAARRARQEVKPAVSPLAPPGFPEIAAIDGVRMASVAAGVRYQGRDDVMLALLSPGTVIAGVTTRSATRAAPVLDIEAKLAAPADTSSGAAVIVNAGNANAFTGTHGAAAVATLTAAVARESGVPVERVFSCSTGVIGEKLPEERITAILNQAIADCAPGGWERAARAIMTTDTFPKGATQVVETSGGPIHLAGIAKGSGMIAPDMATMLVFLFTDARISQCALQHLVSALCQRPSTALRWIATPRPRIRFWLPRQGCRDRCWTTMRRLKRPLRRHSGR